MSLMQLLATSRSIDAAKDGPTRYKMAEQNLLPRFSVPRRGARGAPPEAPANSVASLVNEPVPPSRLETASLFDFHLRPSKATQKTPAVPSSKLPSLAAAPVELAHPAPEPEATIAKQTLPEAANPFVAVPSVKIKKSRWSLFETLFVRRRKKHRNGKLVQGEWVLDQVTVVRNDLSDADLEVVAGEASAREGSAARTSKRESMTQALARFTTRFQRMERKEQGGGREEDGAGKEINFPEMAIRS